MLKKINIDLKNLFANFGNLSKKFAYVFWMILILTLFLEFFILKSTLDVFLNSRKSTNQGKGGAGVRINFQQYEKALDYIETGKRLNLQDKLITNPFRVK